MKKSSQVRLMLTKALALTALSGCSQQENLPTNWGMTSFQPEAEDPAQTYTNNQHHPQHGYYHASSRTWYPYPWGFQSGSQGYFYDGTWSKTAKDAPETTVSKPRAVAKAAPTTSRTSRGIFGRSFGGRSSIS